MVFQDEASLSNTATVSYMWAEKGKQPRINQKQRKRERKTLFGCIEPETGIVITGKADRGNTISFFSFLLLVVKTYHGRKVVMVLDNVPYHHAKRLKPILERYKHRIELVYLPPYSPDLNPIERIWWYMRKKITHNRYVQNLQDRINNFDLFISQFKVENEIGKNLAKLIVNI
ncbi:IS630 family transposase [uncultured Pedobacter sp.]|uniref:IS630 family transposase n=1 Tax=uncultured Pedobacter sp. TaxID=246139 RepID=UPI0025DF0174|nr:IS630 family transposase [uncultured Pedobacter sp.]